MMDNSNSLLKILDAEQNHEFLKEQFLTVENELQYTKSENQRLDEFNRRLRFERDTLQSESDFQKNMIEGLKHEIGLLEEKIEGQKHG